MLSYNNITPIIYVFMVPFGENPSCLQTTLPSLVDQKSSQTVPHWLLKQISTLPSAELRPPRSLISPSRQGTEAREVTLVVWLRSWIHIQYGVRHELAFGRKKLKLGCCIYMCVWLRETTTDEIVARTWERSRLLVMLEHHLGMYVAISHNIYVYTLSL